MFKMTLIIIASLLLHNQAMAGEFVRPQITETENTHKIQNGLEIEISEKGFKYLTGDLDKIGSAFGFNLKNNQLDSVSKKLPPISLSELAETNPTATSVLQSLNKITNIIIGLQINDPKFEFDAENMAYNVNYSKIELAPMPALVSDNASANGSIGFVLKVVIDGFNLSADVAVAHDKNNPLLGPIEMIKPEVKLVSPSIYFALPFIITSKDNGEFGVTISKGHTNIANIDIQFSHQKIQRPETTISIDHNCSHMSALAQKSCVSDFNYLINNEQLINDIEAQVPQLMDYAKQYISEVTESKLTEILSDNDGNEFNKSVTIGPFVEYMPIEPIGANVDKEINHKDSNIDAFRIGDRILNTEVNYKTLTECFSRDAFTQKDELDQDIKFITQETLFKCFGINSNNQDEAQFWKVNKINFFQARICAYDNILEETLDNEIQLTDTRVTLNCIGDTPLGLNLKANHFSSGTTNGLNLGFDISIEDLSSVYGTSLDKVGANSVLNSGYGQKTDFSAYAPKDNSGDPDFEVALSINSKIINSLITKSFERGYFNQMESVKTSEQVWRAKGCGINPHQVTKKKSSEFGFGPGYNETSKVIRTATRVEESALIMSRPPVIVTSLDEFKKENINNRNSSFWKSDKYVNIKRIFKNQKLQDEELFLKLNIQVAQKLSGAQAFFVGAADDVVYVEMDLILLVKKLQGSGQLGLFMVDFDPDSIKNVNKSRFKKNIRKEVKKAMACAMDEWINHPTAETSSEYGMALIPVIPLDKEIKGVSLDPKKITVDKNGNLIMYSNFNRSTDFDSNLEKK